MRLTSVTSTLMCSAWSEASVSSSSDSLVQKIFAERVLRKDLAVIFFWKDSSEKTVAVPRVARAFLAGPRFPLVAAA